MQDHRVYVMVEQHDSTGVKPVRVPTAMSQSLRARVAYCVVAQTEESARHMHEGTQEGVSGKKNTL